jgi:circadian clock protein KaiC
MYIKTRGISPLVIWEAQQGLDSSYSVTQAGMSFLVDCLVLLKFVEINSSMKKALVIMKMRGSDHDKRLREYEITAHGVRVRAPFSGYEGIITGSPHRSLTQEVAGAWDDAFTRTKHKQ